MSAEQGHQVEFRPRDAGWQVPDSSVALFSAKQHRYVLVIPVINEGERIRQQLETLAAIGPNLDVVIADGGSTDGSLDDAHLSRCGVRALLTKTGAGRLSAQLRMAYAWALDEGYAGVVTVDGNGKDSLDTLPQFIAALDRGVDYVQGSRYLLGGAEQNTPLDRKIAGRFIHAPILSLSAGCWISDTTNGYRAYSARALRDERVAPFRDVFQHYSLLAYLTVRTIQLGYNFEQVPVTRSYPSGEATPTKIRGASARLAMVMELLLVATNAFAPDDRGPIRSTWRSSAIVTLSISILALLFLSRLAVPLFSPDSWAYYELANTIGVDFYRLTHIRTYWTEVPYSASFPPLWPILIAGMDFASGLGARGQYALGFLCFAGFVWISELTARKTLECRWLGLSVGIVLLAQPGMIDELLSARAIPAQLLLYSAVLGLISAGQRITVLRGALIGLLVGLSVMNRFDALPFAILMIATTAILSRDTRVTAAALAVLVLTIIPWVAYSLSTFGVAFATDNKSVVFSSARFSFYNDWWPEGSSTVFDDPYAWFVKLGWNTVSLIHQGVLKAGTLLLLGSAFMLIPVVLVAAIGRRQRSSVPPVVRGEGRGARLLFLPTFAIAILGSASSYIATGYMDARYFAPLHWILLFCALAGLFQGLLSRVQRQTMASWVVCVALVVAALGVYETIQSRGFSRLSQWSSFTDVEFDANLLRCVSSSDRTLIINDAITASRLGALNGVSAMILPQNLADGRLHISRIGDFTREFDVNHVVLLGNLVTPDQLGDWGYQPSNCFEPLFTRHLP